MKKVLFLLLFSLSALFAGGKALYTIDFSKQPNGDAKAWLKSKGFKFLLDASALSMKFQGGKLVMETKRSIAGVIGLELPKSKYIRAEKVLIEWGVERFPKGADWAKGNNRLAIGALITMGTKKLSSGLPFGINAAPAFFGPFIGEKERVGGRYLGMLYKEGGRYYCVANKKGTVTTTMNLAAKYRKEFKKPLPPVTAIAFQMNTKDTSGGAKAFIKRITFYGK